MKKNECDVVEWRFDEWSRINRGNREERGPKMMKNGCKIWRDDTPSLDILVMRLQQKSRGGHQIFLSSY